MLLLEKVPKNQFPNSLVIIPIEELEAWLLTDKEALREVFRLKNYLKYEKTLKKFRRQRSICEISRGHTGRKDI